MSFISNAQSDAEKILQRLDRRFRPRVSSILVPTDAQQPIPVGPEGTVFTSDSFHGVRERAAELRALDPRSHSYTAPDPFHGWTASHELHEQAKLRGIRYRALTQAVTEAANSIPESQELVAFVSWPFSHDNGDALLAVQVQRDIYESYCSLTIGTYTGTVIPREYRRERSLIEAVSWQFLNETARVFTTEEHIPPTSNIRDQEYLVLQAARALMQTPTIAASGGQSAQGLFDPVNNLSTLKYEGKEGAGTLVFASPSNPHVQVSFSLASPVPLTTPGAVRKLLQMATQNLSLLCDGRRIFGLGTVSGSYPLSVENVFTVRFTKQSVWSLYHGPNAMMHVRHGVPSINVPGFPEQQFRFTLKRVFGNLEKGNVDNLCRLAARAAVQSHGCMLVISLEAAPEAHRLRSQGTPITPIPMTTELIDRVTAIDGSVLIDPLGYCHAIGVILDGAASDRGSSERGARYNSAVRYVYNRKTPDTIAVVKSEDGMVNVFPE